MAFKEWLTRLLFWGGERTLQDRAREFLQRPSPFGDYAPDNLTDGLIRRYLNGGPWDDPEFRDLLSICIAAAQSRSHRS